VRVGGLGVAGVQVGAVAQCRIGVRADERSEVDRGARARVGVGGGLAEELDALFFGDLSANGFKGICLQSELMCCMRRGACVQNDDELTCSASNLPLAVPLCRIA
jgi:hypothetical protein